MTTFKVHVLEIKEKGKRWRVHSVYHNLKDAFTIYAALDDCKEHKISDMTITTHRVL